MRTFIHSQCPLLKSYTIFIHSASIKMDFIDFIHSKEFVWMKPIISSIHYILCVFYMLREVDDVKVIYAFYWPYIMANHIVLPKDLLLDLKRCFRNWLTKFIAQTWIRTTSFLNIIAQWSLEIIKLFSQLNISFKQ